MKVRWLKRAHAQLREQLAWWKENTASEHLLKEEVRRVQKLLAATPHAGVVVRNARPGTRRVLLTTQHTLYYRVDERRGFVEVLRFWHTARGQEPRL